MVSSTLIDQKLPECRVLPGPNFLVFVLNTEIYSVLSPNTAKDGPEKTLSFQAFDAVSARSDTFHGFLLHLITPLPIY